MRLVGRRGAQGRRVKGLDLKDEIFFNYQMVCWAS
jgi:hypothetical protein